MNEGNTSLNRSNSPCPDPCRPPTPTSLLPSGKSTPVIPSRELKPVSKPTTPRPISPIPPPPSVTSRTVVQTAKYERFVGEYFAELPLYTGNGNSPDKFSISGSIPLPQTSLNSTNTTATTEPIFLPHGVIPLTASPKSRGRPYLVPVLEVDRSLEYGTKPIPADPTYPYVVPNSEIIDEMEFGPEPMSMECPYCKEDIVTELHYRVGMWALLSILFFFILGLFTGITLLILWLPCVMKVFKDVKHYCPKCKTLLGIYKRKWDC